MPLDFIGIKVNVAPDRMSAFFSLVPVEGAVGTLTAEHLEAALAEAGVVHGARKVVINNIVSDWNANPRKVDTPIAAGGTAPIAEKVGALRMTVRHLSAESDIKAIIGRKFFWEVASIANKFQRVDHGTVIARREIGAPGTPGYDVFGAVIPPKNSGDAQEPGTISEKYNVYIAGNTYTAATTGIVYIDNIGDLHVMPLDFDGVVEIRILSNLMSAEMTAYPAGEGGKMPSGEFIRGLIKSRRVEFGIDEEALNAAISRYAEGIDCEETIVIANGLPAVKGDDGSVEFCFNIESSPAPVINEDGSADYKNINIVTSVSKGTVLARLLPPSKGTPGKDVMGKPMPALDGSPAQLPVGANTATPKENPSVLVATTDGIVKYDGVSINVSEGYFISGDVDYSTGNVKYENSINVKGDVKSGFEVECGGDLEVNGIIENAMVNVKGNVLCKYGFVGNGKGIIEAGGDVSLGYVKNQTVIAGGNVNVAKECINSSITSRKSIHVYGNTLSVAGGTLIASESIVAKTIGNMSGVESVLQICPNLELADELDKINEQLAKLNENSASLARTMRNMPPAQKLNKDFVSKIQNAIYSTDQQVTRLKKRTDAIHAAMRIFDNCFIRIDRCAYPGTTFMFGENRLSIRDMIAGGKTVRYIKGEIKIL